MNTHTVLKTLPGPNGKSLTPGTKVDASEWRNAPLLVEQRYLKPLDGVNASAEYPSDEVADLRGRVTEMVLADLRENGPIAQALKSLDLMPAPRKQRAKQPTSAVTT